MRHIIRSKIALSLSVATSMLLWPATAYAHHPGIIGPVSHLGADTIIRVILAALLDGVNPTALGVLLFVCYRARKHGISVGKQALLFLSGMFLTYIVAGVILRITYASFGPTLPIQLFQIVIAGLLFQSGLQELLKALKREPAPAAEVPGFIERLMSRFDLVLQKGFTFVVGMIIGVVELFATGAIYLSFIQAISYDKTAPWWVTVVMMAVYLVAFLVPIGVAYSYRHALIGDMSEKNSNLARRARGVTGVVFMLAALFIAASAIVTIRSISL